MKPKKFKLLSAPILYAGLLTYKPTLLLYLITPDTTEQKKDMLTILFLKLSKWHPDFILNIPLIKITKLTPLKHLFFAPLLKKNTIKNSSLTPTHLNLHLTLTYPTISMLKSTPKHLNKSMTVLTGLPGPSSIKDLHKTPTSITYKKSLPTLSITIFQNS
jgi:hypothetical protein